MKSVSRAIFAFGMLILAVGCASTKQYVPFPDQTKEIDNPEQSRIYVMRPAFVGCAVSMSIKDGDELIGTTGPKSYLCWERDPGKITISGKAENASTLDLDAQKGNVYYIVQNMKMGFLVARNKLELVDEAEGQETLTKCKPPKVTTP